MKGTSRETGRPFLSKKNAAKKGFELAGEISNKKIFLLKLFAAGRSLNK